MSHNIDISIGLGYGSSNSSAAATAPSSIDDLMKHYLKQCLDYHQEQQQQQQQQQQQAERVYQLEAPVFVESLDDAIPASVQTADGSRLDTTPNTIEISGTTSNIEACLAQSFEPLVMTQEEKQRQFLQAEALAKARAVVLSFSAPPPSTDLRPSEYREQRMRHAQQEKDRFHQALMKNLRYIAQRQDKKLQRQLLQIERAKAHEKQLFEQQQAHLSQRTKLVASNMGPGRRVADCTFLDD
jgi:hypothetical protein